MYDPRTVCSHTQEHDHMLQEEPPKTQTEIYLAPLLSEADLQHCCAPTNCPISTQDLGNPN